MKFRALIEKLDWKGDIVRTVKEYEDDRFKPDLICFLREVVETGEIKTKDLPTPSWTWDHSVSGVIRRIAPAVSQYSFSESDPGLRLVVGEFYPALEAQFVLMDKTRSRDPMWIKTDHDIFPEV